LTKLNNELARNNDTSMFITVFCAILDLRTGQGSYANGGHNPPFIVRANGGVEEVPRTGGPLLGPMPDMTYGAGTLQLNVGDLLFMYTDGVVEAENEQQMFYGNERTRDQLAAGAGRNPDVLLRQLREDIRAFAGKAPQFKATRGASRRELHRWMNSARTPLPEPLSPVIRIVASLDATW